MSDPIGHLGAVSRQYQIKAAEYRSIAVAAAEAEAAHKSARAQAILRAMASAERMTHAKAEAIAEADEEVAELYRRRLVTAAEADAHKALLFQLHAQSDAGQTIAASAREVDRLHAQGHHG